MSEQRKQTLPNNSELEVAKRWLKQAKDSERPLTWAEGRFWEWHPQRGYYVPIESDQLAIDVQRTMWGWPVFHGHKVVEKTDEDGNVTTEKVEVTKPLRPMLSACEKVVRAARGLLLFKGEPPRHPVVATQTGVWVSVVDGRVLELDPTPATLVTSCFPVAYDAGAPAPERWLQTLEELWDGDDDVAAKIDLLHEFIGACIFGLATEYQTALILYGTGGNGKSVITDTINALFDDHMVSHVAPQDWEKEYHAAMLAGSRLNLVEELPSRQMLSTSTFKSVISGGSIVGRHIREKPFSFRPRAGHIFAANELPRSGDMSIGFWRRAQIVEFKNRFDNRSTRILTKDLVRMHVAEATGIFRLCVEGVQRLLARGTFTSVSQDSALEEWRLDSCSVASFLQDHTEPSEREGEGWAQETTGDDLYAAYRRYAEKNGFHPVNSRSFFRRVQQNGVPNRRVKVGGVRARWYPLALA